MTETSLILIILNILSLEKEEVLNFPAFPSHNYQVYSHTSVEPRGNPFSHSFSLCCIRPCYSEILISQLIYQAMVKAGLRKVQLLYMVTILCRKFPLCRKWKVLSLEDRKQEEGWSLNNGPLKEQKEICHSDQSIYKQLALGAGRV